MSRTQTIDDVTLHLASPDNSPGDWIGQREILKQLLACWLVMKVARIELNGVTLPMLLGAGCLAGIGFTMSIFISELAYTNEAFINQAKVGILIASLASGVIGAIVLNATLPQEDAVENEDDAAPARAS